MQQNTLKNELLKIKDRAKDYLKIGVIIGPEGGLDIEEVQILKANGAKVVTLGKRILRTETASILLISNILYEFNEM